MRKLIFILLFSVFALLSGYGQNNKYVYKDSTLIEDTVAAPDQEFETNTINTDSTMLDTGLVKNHLEVSEDSVKYWKNLKSFGYVKYLDSLLKDKQNREKQKLESNNASSSTEDNSESWLGRFLASTIIKFLLWSFAISFVLFILYKLFLSEGVFRKNIKSSNVKLPNEEEVEISSESDFEALIQQAKNAGNYRMAVRYWYLQILHNLNEKKYLELAADKTNFQYVSEIQNKSYQQDFASVTLNYEYVWYGQFAIDENIFNKMESGFRTFNNKI